MWITGFAIQKRAAGWYIDLPFFREDGKGNIPPFAAGGVKTVDTADEALMDVDEKPAKNEGKNETWPFPPEDETREFEQFLMDIGLRI